MKIAVITERSDVCLGGAERSVFELSSQLASRGNDVTLLAAKGDGHARNTCVLCKDVPGKRVMLNVFGAACLKHFETNKYDIVHSVLPLEFADVYQPRGGAYLEAIEQNAQSYDNGMVTCLKRATSFFNFRRSVLASAEKKLCRKSAGPVMAALSNYVADQFHRHYKLDPGRIKVIPNGVKINKPADPAEFAEVKHKILKTYPEDISPVFFLFGATNFRLKGLVQLLKAIARAKSIEPAVQMHLLIAGNDNSQPYTAMAKKLGIEGVITFLGPVAHMQNALVLSDAAVLPTFYDPASRFILEALAMAKPVITTAYNGSADLFTNNRHGVVIDDPRNINALARALIHLSNRVNLDQAAEAIRADNVVENVSIERHVSQLMELFNDILTRKSACHA